MPEDDDLDSMFSDTLAPQPDPVKQPANPLFRRLDETDLWRPDGIRFLFIQTRCTQCGCTSSIPEGIYLHKTHSRNSCEHLERIQVDSDGFASLPRSVEYLYRDMPFCENCLKVSP